MSTATTEHGFTPPSKADLTSAEAANPLIKGYLVLKPSIDRIAGFRNRVTAMLADTFSQPLTLPSTPLRPEESPSSYDIAAAEEAALSPKRSFLPKWALHLALPGTGLFVAACSSTIPQEVNKPAIVEPAQPTITVTPTSTTQATVEAQKPPTSEPTKTSEVKAEPCSILPEEYCSKVDLIPFKNPKGEQVWLIGVKLPVGTPISSPISGKFSTTSDKHYATLNDPDNDPTLTGLNFTGDLEYLNNQTTTKVNPGDQVALIGKGGYTVESVGDYNLVIGSSARNPATGEFYSPNDTLKRYFPNARLVQTLTSNDQASTASRYIIDTPK